MESNKKDDNVLRKSYQPTIVGNSYRPILREGESVKSFVPPKGGTGARILELKTVTPSVASQKK
jgi:hypothetical protein